MQLFNYPLLIEEDCQLLDETIHLDLLINYLNIVLLCFSKHLPRKAEEIRGKNFFYFFFYSGSCAEILPKLYLFVHVKILKVGQKDFSNDT